MTYTVQNRKPALVGHLAGTFNRLQKKAHLVRCGKKARIGVAVVAA